MKNLVLLIALGVLSFCASSCKKAGPGGDSSISVFVKHHSQIIPGSVVYLKYGAKEFPGSDPADYDVVKETADTGHLAGHTHFEELNKGNYYLYATGFDSTIMEIVTGGIPIRIEKNGDLVETDIPVTEDSH